MTDQERIPPHNLEAEGAVIGSMLLDREMVPVARTYVAASDFYAHVHETLFSTIVKLYEAEEPVDKIAVAEQLRRDGKLDKVGGLAYLSGLMDTVPTASNVEFYARIVADKAGSRNVIAVAHDMLTKAYSEHFENSGDLQDYAIRTLQKATSGNLVRLESLQEVLERVVANIAGEKTRAYQSPWEKLDSYTQGFTPGEFVVWAAAPGMGKSILFGNYAEYMAQFYRPKAFVLFSLEMTAEDTAQRILASRSGVPVHKIRKGTTLDAEDWRMLDLAQNGALLPANLVLVDRHPRKSLADIKRAARQAHRLHGGLSGIGVDHIGYIAELATAGERKHQALDKVCMELIALGDELNCPVHAIYHLNRKPGAGRPTIFDLRDGGNTEGHATTILFPWRPNPEGLADVLGDDGLMIPTTHADISIGKSRHGKPGRVAFRFLGEEALWIEEERGIPWFETPGERGGYDDDSEHGSIYG